MNNRDQALLYINSSQSIKRMIATFIPNDQVLDFKTYLIMVMCEMDPSKLIKSYEEGYIDWLCLSIINTHAKNLKSNWNTQYRLSPLPKVYKQDPEMIGILEEAQGIHWNQSEITYEDGDEILGEFTHPIIYDQETQEESDLSILQMRMIQSSINQIKPYGKQLPLYDRTLWRYRYEEGESMKEIARKTGISYSSIYYNLRKNESNFIKSLEDKTPLLKQISKKILNMNELELKLAILQEEEYQEIDLEKMYSLIINILSEEEILYWNSIWEDEDKGIFIKRTGWNQSKIMRMKKTILKKILANIKSIEYK